jgi:uncharacterized membrane protein (UPF0127 family)
MIVVLVIFILALVVLLLAWYMVSRPNPPLAASTVHIGGDAFSVELATSSLTQARGLSGRTGLGENAGMLFLFNKPGVQNFWMKDMQFPIDIIWIGDGKVLGFAQNAPAPASGAMLWQLPVYSSPDGVDTVLEVQAGTVAKDNIKVGDAVTENSI